MKQNVRATGILIEDDCILLVEQRVTASLKRVWSLPGGTVESGETLEACLIREMKEETGLDVAVDKLLYVCDRIMDEHHTIHLTFLIKRLGGQLQVGFEPEREANPIKSVRMAPLSALREYGFSHRFCELASAGFPESGAYKGLIANIGL